VLAFVEVVGDHRDFYSVSYSVRRAVLTLNCQLNDSYTTPRPHIRLGLTVNFGHNRASR